MQKIMFNDQYRLTEAVLEGRKTQTRRIIKCPREFKGEWVAGFNIHIRQSDKTVVSLPCMYDADEREFDGGEILPRYMVGEIVAIAQSYKDLGYNEMALNISPKDWRIVRGTLGKCKGWNNKMFVRPEACVHQIKITNVRIQRLQDISDEDCLAEGIRKIESNKISKAFGFDNSYEIPNQFPVFDSPREAYAALINRVSGKGTWESNPWVFVYEFELVK